MEGMDSDPGNRYRHVVHSIDKVLQKIYFHVLVNNFIMILCFSAK